MQLLDLMHLVHNGGNFVYFIPLRPCRKSLGYFSGTLWYPEVVKLLQMPLYMLEMAAT